MTVATPARRVQQRIAVPLMLVGSLGLSARPAAAHAQCPDGTPPPCGPAAARRDPPLNERTWLILPFTNAARAADAELIGAASVNLLYQDLSRFADMRVVSDDRVADLVRRIAPGERARVGLETGRELARRVGAGRLVLGQFLAAGGQAQLAASLYDVRSGRELRAVRERVSGYTAPQALDSLTAVFDRVARALLDVPTVPHSRQGLAGTTSLEAFRAFHHGMALYRAGSLDSARRELERAVALDSSYAWARFRLYWIAASLGAPFTEIRHHLVAAERAGAVLPARERALISGWIALPRGQLDVICERAAELLAEDPTDAEAWHFRGHCLAGDNLVVRSATDSARWSFRTSWRATIDAFERATRHDPGHVESFQDLVGRLTARGRAGCAVSIRAPCPTDQQFSAVVLLDADTVATEPHPASAVVGRPDLEPAAMAAWRGRLDRALAAATRHVVANPGWRGELTLAGLLLTTGDRGQATRALAAAGYAARLPTYRATLHNSRIELALRRGWPDSAARLLDSLAADTAPIVQPWYFTALGRFTRDQAAATPDSVRAARAAWLPIFAGVLPAAFDSIERRFASLHAATTRDRFLVLSSLVAFRRRGPGPVVDTAASHALLRAQAWLARGDTGRARALLLAFDSAIGTRPVFMFDDGAWLFAAEGLLATGDSARARDRLADWARRWPSFPEPGTIFDQTTTATATVRLVGRTWLLFADLSREAGRVDDARRAYRLVLGLWEGGEAPLQPIVARVRSALASLGN